MKRICVRAGTDCEVSVEGTRIVLRAGGSVTEIADLAGIGSLRGAHNAENARAATAALLSLPEPLPPSDRRCLKTFPGLAHRMEELGRQGRTLFVNDSKATNADSTEKALLSFPGRHPLDPRRQAEGGRHRCAQPNISSASPRRI